jgi:hypothetical protein
VAELRLSEVPNSQTIGVRRDSSGANLPILPKRTLTSDRLNSFVFSELPKRTLISDCRNQIANDPILSPKDKERLVGHLLLQ